MGQRQDQARGRLTRASKFMTTPKLNAPTSPASNGSADLDMMNEWATSLCSRLDNIDLRHADIGLEWFYSFAKSKIKRAEELRAIESVAKLSPRNK